jgi:hypothetical protein
MTDGTEAGKEPIVEVSTTPVTQPEGSLSTSCAAGDPQNKESIGDGQGNEESGGGTQPLMQDGTEARK